MSRPCPLCQSDQTRQIFVKQSVPYRRCRACGFRFALPGENPNFHAIDQFEPAYLQYLEDHVADQKNHARLLHWMGRFADLRAGRVLDIGCGSGKWVRFLRRQGIDAAGVEPSAALYEQYLSREPHFRHVTAEELAAQEASGYPVITALDVLEHVASPRPFLQSLRQLLAPGGVAFLSTPDAGSLPAVLCRRFWHFYERYHLSYFSRRSLARECRQAGLRVLYCRHRGKCFPLGYMVRYAALFVFGKTIRRPMERLDRIHVPFNPMDIMYAAVRREA